MSKYLHPEHDSEVIRKFFHPDLRIAKKTALIILLCLVYGAGMASGTTKEPSHMFVRDGQIKSDWFEVYVTNEINDSMNLFLSIVPQHSLKKTGKVRSQQFNGYAYPNQHWEEQVNGKMVSFSGTLMLFNLSDLNIPIYKSAIRVTPGITWSDGKNNNLICDYTVYIGDKNHALLRTFIVLAIILIFIGSWAKRKSPKHLAIMLISGPDGYLSLWRTQLAVWTVAIGAMVYFFGILRLHVPEIPDSLVALMGMSLLTGGLSGAKGHSDAVARMTKVPLPSNPGKPSLPDLIGNYDPVSSMVQLSLQKAQMAFWTILMVVLFVGKTIAEGQLWDVPWQLVALTGFSQAGYIGDKYAKGIPN